MIIHDNSTHARLVFTNAWQTAPEISDPTGGTTIDAEARGAIVALASALRNLGMIS